MWGGPFTAIRILVRHASVFTVSFLRLALTTLGLLAVSAIVRPERRRLARADRGKVLLLALTGVSVYHVALGYGEHFVSANVASLIVSSMPVMVALLSRAFLNEELGATKWAGILLALAGVSFCSSSGDRPGRASRSRTSAARPSWRSRPCRGRRTRSSPSHSWPKYGPLQLLTTAMVLGTVLLAPVGVPATIRDLGRSRSATGAGSASWPSRAARSRTRSGSTRSVCFPRPTSRRGSTSCP